MEELLDHLRIADPVRLRENPIFLAFGVGQAVVLTRELAERADIVGRAVDTVDVRLHPGQALRPARRRPGRRPRPGGGAAAHRPEPGGVAHPVRAPAADRRQHPGRSGAGGAVALAGGAPGRLGVAAATGVQPAIVTAGTAVRPRDRWCVAGGAARVVGIPVRLARSARGGWRPAHPAHTDPQFIEDERARAYAADLARGVDRFLGPAVTTAPCAAVPPSGFRLRAPDMIQCKAGMFRVDTCDECGTNFQNPQLTPEGLAFYYRDFYDGSGEMDTEMMFSADWPLYQRRAHLVDGYAEPRRWLDVGGGHGHFCLVASSEHPETRFELLDQPAGHRGAPARLGRRRPRRRLPQGGRVAGLRPTTSSACSTTSSTRPTRSPSWTRRAGARARRAPDRRGAGARLPAGLVVRLGVGPVDAAPAPQPAAARHPGRSSSSGGFEVVHADRRAPRQPWDASWASFQLITRLAPGPNAPWTLPRSRRHRMARLAGAGGAGRR